MTTIEKIIIANAVPCKKWIDCENRDDENFCVVKVFLMATGFVESGVDFFARVISRCDEKFSRAIGGLEHIFVSEIETRGECCYFKIEEIVCPNCRSKVAPSSVSVCPNCRELRCRSCREKIACANCGRELCAGCVVVKKPGRRYVYDSCFSCGARV